MSTTADQPWQTKPMPELVAADTDAPPQVRVWPAKTFQTIDGFGGCFNELNWVALGKASEADRNSVLNGLFGDDDCAFNMGRD